MKKAKTRFQTVKKPVTWSGMLSVKDLFLRRLEDEKDTDIDILVPAKWFLNNLVTLSEANRPYKQWVGDLKRIDCVQNSIGVAQRLHAIYVSQLSEIISIWSDPWKEFMSEEAVEEIETNVGFYIENLLPLLVYCQIDLILRYDKYDSAKLTFPRLLSYFSLRICPNPEPLGYLYSYTVKGTVTNNRSLLGRLVEKTGSLISRGMNITIINKKCGRQGFNYALWIGQESMNCETAEKFLESLRSFNSMWKDWQSKNERL